MANLARCARCGHENDAAASFCLDCGAPLAGGRLHATTEALCRSCGAALMPGFRFCGACGKPARPSPTPPPAARDEPAGAEQGAAAPRGTERIRLSLVRNDGRPGPVFSVEEDEATCGRTEGAIRLPDDPTVSPRHARFSVEGGKLRVEDLHSVNGTFVRIKEPRRLATGDELRIGRQLLRLEPLPRAPGGEDGRVHLWGTKDPGYRFRLSQLIEGGGLGDVFPLRAGENAIGREAGDVAFPADRYVSARHARVVVEGNEVTLADAGSSNGTYVKIAAPTELVAGDQVIVGTQLLLVE
jgi:pSer/pThr/pTyr-binding forkhead associated (FHA) protein